MIKRPVHFPRRNVSVTANRAITTVSDRSFFTELLVVVLAATFAWPGSVQGSAGKPGGAIGAVREGYLADQGGARASYPAIEPAADHHVSKLRGVLDDDPAILRDDSEDWLEGTSDLLPHYAASAQPGFLPVSDERVSTVASALESHAWPIHFLCSYQC